MKKPKKLRSRIALYFCGYLAVLLILYSAALYGMLKLAEDLAFDRQLSEIAEKIARHVEQQGVVPACLPMHITAYADLSSVPPHLRNFVANRQPGVFEINTDEFDFHAALAPIPSTGKIMYVFHDVASIETNEQFQSILLLALSGVGLGVLFVGWLLARSLSNRILNPISELAVTVQSISPHDGSARLKSFATTDEVGVLAGTIRRLLERISAFTRREREFTGHASHELRTPLAVIKSAMELLKSRSSEKDKAMRAPLARIERSVTHIETLIHTFLLLARRGQNPDADEICDLKIIIQKVVAEHQHLLKEKPVTVDVRISGDCRVRTSPALATIALGNLVRNAFQYTMEGGVEIHAAPGRVNICDTGPGIDAARRDAGIGLTIVERLCESLNWRFVIRSRPGGGTRADLLFDPPETGTASPAS